jgi:hypothetical protein
VTPEAFQHAVETLRVAGARRIALYGAGRDAGALVRVIDATPIPVACIVDDDPRRRGGALIGRDVVDAAEAIARGVDGVVVASNLHAEKIWAACDVFREHGVRVVCPSGPGAWWSPPERAPLRAVGPCASGAAPTTVPCVLAVLCLHDRLDAFWTACDGALRAAGSGLVALVTDTHVTPEPEPLTGVSGSFSATAMLGRTWPDHAPIGPRPAADLVARCLAFDRVYWRDEPFLETLTSRGVRAAWWLLEDAIRRLRPGLGLLLNGDASTTIVAEAVFRRHAVPVAYCERGAFNPSVVVDPLGVEGRLVSSLTDDPAWRERLGAAPRPGEEAAADALARHLSEGRAENWPGPAPAAPASTGHATGTRPARARRSSPPRRRGGRDPGSWSRRTRTIRPPPRTRPSPRGTARRSTRRRACTTPSPPGASSPPRAPPSAGSPSPSAGR